MLRIVINMIYTDVGMQGSIEGTDTVNRYSKKNGTDTVKMQSLVGLKSVRRKCHGKEKGTKKDALDNCWGMENGMIGR